MNAKATRAPASRLKRVVFALVAIGIALALALTVLEVTLRIVDWPAPGLYRDGRGPLPTQTATATHGSWTGYQGDGRLRHPDYDVAVYINRDGFRERELDPTTASEWRVGLFGDSFTAGYGVERDERFGDVWFESVRVSSPSRSLWNFGAPGTGLWQSADFLAGGEQYELDEIIAVFYGGNDLIDNALWSDLRGRSPDRARRRPLRNWLRLNCRAAMFLWVRGVRLFLWFDPHRYVPTRESVVRLWPASRQALDAMHEAAGERPLTIWYLPGTHEWDEALWQSARDAGMQEADRHALRERVERWARRRGVPLVDATPSLAGRSVTEINHPVDPHWNADGHRLVADGLAADPDSCYHARRRRDADAR